jgi:aspartyl-tRNA(Asn)/glutamyl-tRNA(Gln) amidotransferase subunit A
VAQPHELTLTQAAAALRAKELSPVELVESLLRRTEALDPALLAWATLTPEHAMEAARRAERELFAGTVRSPIHGVPYGAKDIFDTAGIRTAGGTKIWAERVPDTDAVAIATVNAAGAILLGKTHTTEFADGDPAVSRNPWNAMHTAGGSSTGSGVAVAARLVPWAFGSQTVGSVLRPAAYNGVVGFKPTFGRISRRGVIPMAQTFDHVGVLTRCVEDAATLLGVLAGRDPDDPDSADVPVDDYAAELDRRHGPRIGFVRTFFLEESDAETRMRMEQVAQELAQAGATIEEINPGIDFPHAFRSHRLMQESEMADWHELLFVGNEKLYGPKISAYIQNGFKNTAKEYVRAMNYRLEMRNLASTALEQVDALLMPTAAGPAPQDLTQTGDTRFQSPWSFTGFPSISVPMGLASNGLPLGAQFAGAPFQEARLLGVARWAEQVLGVELEPPL